MLQHASLETPSSYYEDNILELEKLLEDSFRPMTNKECNDDKIKSLMQPKRLFKEDDAVTPSRDLNKSSKESASQYSQFPCFNPNACSISSPISLRSEGNIADCNQELDSSN